MKDKEIRPDYYFKGGLECRQVQAAATCDLTGADANDTATAIKYLWRWKEKNGVKDLIKARTYIDFLIERNQDESVAEKQKHEEQEKAAPCPCCGSGNLGFLHFGGGNVSVICEECRYVGPMGDGKCDAVKKWNKEE